MKEGSLEHEIYLNLLSLGLSEKYSKAGIYSISIDNKLVYIGKAKDMLVRIANHLKEIEVNTKSNKYKVLR
jgi:predicted GIY-YIG superfamily endonuclease